MKEQIKRLIERDPDTYIPLLKEILRLHKENPLWEEFKSNMENYPDTFKEGDFMKFAPPGVTSGFRQGSDLSLGGGVLSALMSAQVLTANLGSNKNKAYGILSPNDIEEALEDVEGKEFEREINMITPIEIPKDIFAPVVGYEMEKKLILMGLKSDKPVHFILKGPPSTSKSVFLMELEHIPGSVAVEGTTSSKCGINEILLDERPKILIVDEIAHLKAEERTVLLELTGKGTASDNKHDRHIKIDLPTKVFAACNHLEGFTPEFISRFEIIEFHEYNRDEFEQVAINVLVMREGVTRQVAEYIAEKTWALPKTYRDIRQSIRIARMTGGDCEMVDWYIKYKIDNMKGNGW